MIPTDDRYFEAVQAAHRLAVKLYDVALGNATRYGDTNAAYWEAQQDLHYFTVKLALLAPVGTKIVTPDGPLIVATRYGDTTTLTEDGGEALPAWHRRDVDGDLAPYGESERYERYTTEGRIAHGYVDKRSRKIVQTG